MSQAQLKHKLILFARRKTPPTPQPIERMPFSSSIHFFPLSTSYHLRPCRFRKNLNLTVVRELVSAVTKTYLWSVSFSDLNLNPLVCDCDLWWLLEWARNSSAKFSPLPKCEAPPSLRGQPLRKLKAGPSQCAWPASEDHSSALELSPSHNQVRLYILCRVKISDSKSSGKYSVILVLWYYWASKNGMTSSEGTFKEWGIQKALCNFEIIRGRIECIQAFL